MAVTNTALALLAKYLPKYPHQPDYAESEIGDAFIAKWEKDGQPYLWKLVDSRILQSKACVEVYEDRARGLIVAIYKDQVFQMLTNEVITHTEFVVINSRFYCCGGKYIWI